MASQIAENSLALLDDLAGTDVQASLDRFAAIETWIDSSIARLTLENSAASGRAVEESATALAPAQDIQPKAEPLLPTANPSLGETNSDPHIVFSNTLSQRSSRQKLQNESLIKALQELRARMNDSKARSGKVSARKI